MPNHFPKWFQQFTLPSAPMQSFTCTIWGWILFKFSCIYWDDMQSSDFFPLTCHYGQLHLWIFLMKNPPFIPGINPTWLRCINCFHIAGCGGLLFRIGFLLLSSLVGSAYVFFLVVILASWRITNAKINSWHPPSLPIFGSQILPYGSENCRFYFLPVNLTNA